MRARLPGFVATAALALLVLSACPPPETPSENEPRNGNQQPPKVGDPPQDLMSSAARNAPRAGSVTQGSRGEAGTTADRVRWAGSGVQIEDRLLTVNVTGEIDPESGLTYFTDSGQTALAAVVSRISGGSGGQPRPHFNRTDRVVFGPWMYRTGSGFVWGMFADGLAARETAGTPVAGTYVGTTIGVYADALGVVDFFTARVTLVLTANGSLTGSIDGVRSVDGVPVEFEGAQPTITLESADPATDLRKGNTAFNLGGTKRPGVDGKWGASFFDGDVAAGTWGVTDGTRFSVVGAFSATRQ